MQQQAPPTPTPKKLPTVGRVPKDDGTTKSLKMSMGKKKLEEDPEFARMIYQYIVINGAEYCRPHLMIQCHLCMVDGWPQKEEVDEERQKLGLRPSGDPALNERARKWSDLTTQSRAAMRLQSDFLVQRFGKNHAKTHPEHWQKFMQDAKANEKEINDEFFQDTPEVSHCCYWACDKQQQQQSSDEDDQKLLRCTGCGIVKYCCKEHQMEDWKWEHKGECRAPEFILAEFAEDRKRHIAGDYRTREELLEGSSG